uniref:Uncharacterized protein n=1 Tax=Pundamilia nyererei TaxID=303518 RepID=A0A3B4H083_9CICH
MGRFKEFIQVLNFIRMCHFTRSGRRTKLSPSDERKLDVQEQPRNHRAVSQSTVKKKLQLGQDETQDKRLQQKILECGTGLNGVYAPCLLLVFYMHDKGVLSTKLAQQC